MKVLVTGGAGYIGSTTCIALEQAGHVPIVLDSLVTGKRAFTQGRVFYQGDIADKVLISQVLSEHPDIEVTIHMAARVSVPESTERPDLYYRENVTKSLELFGELARHGKGDVVFSSSASLYAFDPSLEVFETSALAPASPYARTKWMMEQVLQDLAATGRMRAVILRYFNPIGAEPGLTCGSHVEQPSHVLGRLVDATLDRGAPFSITGTDYPTRDGTGLRDYIHVWDLARAHVRAVERFSKALDGGSSNIINLGTGAGVTVRELVAAFEAALGAQVSVLEGPRRPGDVAGAFANVDKSAALLDWRAESSLREAIRSAIEWALIREQALTPRLEPA